MIKTEHGKLLIKGSSAEIAADLLIIFDAVIEESPMSLAAALMEFEENLVSKKAEAETNERIKALASVLTLLPQEDLEALKKKAEEVTT